MTNDAQRVARIIAHNTGGAQPETVEEPVVRSIACGTRHMEPKDFENALETALEEGWIEEVDGGGYRAMIPWTEL